ncbi:hypothetical protein ACFLT1_05820 [Bacteroidota bacterium]
MKKIFFTVLLALLTTYAEAQYLKEFSQHDSLYIEELTQLFGSKLSDDEEEIFEQFSERWDSLEAAHKKDIMIISDLMKKRTCRPRPQYIMFLRILEEFHGEDKLGYGYEEFVEGYKNFMSKETTLLKDINNVNNTIFNLLDKSEIYASTSLVWKFETDNFEIINKDKLVVQTRGNKLIGYSRKDSIFIFDAVGYVDPVSQNFHGTSGLVTWERAGLSRENVYAELANYQIRLKSLEYTADSALFHHSSLLSEPARGTLVDRISNFRTPAQALYPEFSTYQSTYELKDIYNGLNYYGALAMQGANLRGTGSIDQDAELEIVYKDTVRVRMFSSLFIIGENILRSNNAEVIIYLEQDSIYHPDLIMNYTKSSELLRLSRSDNYTSLGPYSDSYHSIDLSFDELTWVRTEPFLTMKGAQGAAQGNGLFESFDFFNMEFYTSLQGMDIQNPLVSLWLYSDQVRQTTFSVESFATYNNLSPYMFRHEFMKLHQLGFVYFDFEEDVVTLKPKLFDFIEASAKQRDYDVMQFISRTFAGENNATLNLTNKDLEIHGIPAIFLSDSQNVRIIPENSSIIMKRNRDFQFDGLVQAGLFRFSGNNFFFDYDAFKINLQSVDLMSISATTGQKDALGNSLITTMDNNIESVTGEILIDDPNNKSGLAHHPQYPVFSSRENSFVYFDEESIQDGVYDRNRFYFELVPFTIDSLDNFRRAALMLEGTFVSADILPEMEMEMTLRPDNSLGFYMQTEEEGLPVYGGRATFYNDLEMSSAGLHGYGLMDYITSTTWSDDFLFHPDSMMTMSRRFLEREKGGVPAYPYVENEVAEVRYYSLNDYMTINQHEKAFEIYNDSTYFGGNLRLQQEGLSGDGALVFSDARFESDRFNFLDRVAKADSAGAKLRQNRNEEFSFLTNDMSIDIDMNRREGSFAARADYTLIEFPSNLYETRLDQVNWFMDRDEVVMIQTKYLEENQADIGIDSVKTNGPSYISKHPQQDSLNFKAPLATFNYSTNVLDAEKVPFIEVGDAYIFPAAREVQVLSAAAMTPLRKAKILANKDSKHHMLHNANLVIDSRLHFRGGADYDYVDEFGEVFTFRMTHVEVDTSIRTFGIGEVEPEDNFNLSPYFAYQGEIRMYAPDSLLTFAGGVRLTHDCDIGRYTMKFDSRLDPDSLLIPVAARMQNMDLNNIYAGTLKARDSIHIYPTFLSGRKDYFDMNVTSSEGFLFYDKATRTYEMASLKKLRNQNAKGNYLALMTDSCTLYAEGEIDMVLDYGRVQLKTLGEVRHSIISNQLSLDLLMGMNFMFDPVALDMFGAELDSLPNLKPVDLTRNLYQLEMRNLVDTIMAKRMEIELELYGEYTEIPDSLKFSIFFNDLHLDWVQQTLSYRYNGKVGIGTFGNIQVNKYVDAYVEFVEKGSGDIFDIYLMIDDNTWFYIAYSGSGLQVLSSNRAFNQYVMDLPERDRRIKASGRQKSYVYSLASARRLDLFLDRFTLAEEELGNTQ